MGRKDSSLVWWDFGTGDRMDAVECRHQEEESIGIDLVRSWKEILLVQEEKVGGRGSDRIKKFQNPFLDSSHPHVLIGFTTRLTDDEEMMKDGLGWGTPCHFSLPRVL